MEKEGEKKKRQEARKGDCRLEKEEEGRREKKGRKQEKVNVEVEVIRYYGYIQLG